MSTPMLEIVLVDERGNRTVVGTACVSAINVIKDLILIPAEVLETPISDLDIHKSTRTRILNCLGKVSDLKTVRDLTNVSEIRLMNVCQGISRKSVAAINEALKKYGLRIGFFV